MNIVSPNRLPASALVWQARPGAWVVTVVCKATFHLTSPTCQLASEHEPLFDDDQYVDGDSRKELFAPSDLVPVKPYVDILVVGHAYAPRQQPTTSLTVRLAVGDVRKSFDVLGDGSVGPGGAMRGPAPFTKMPLRHERASGGPGTSNPAGVPRDRQDPDGWRPLPNLRRSDGSPLETACGPISPTWPERRARLGAHAATFPPRDRASLVIPAGLDHGFFNAAPRDQQVRSIAADEALMLENLLAEHALLTTRLPGFFPRVVIEGIGPGPRPLMLRADTLLIDTDKAICTVAFRGSTPLESKPDGLRVVVSHADASAEAVAGVARLAERPGRAPASLDTTEDIPLAFQAGASLPFVGGSFAPIPPSFAGLSRPPAVDPIRSRHQSAIPGSPSAVPSVPEPSSAMRHDAAQRVVQSAAPRPGQPEPAPTSGAITEALELIWLDLDSVPRLRRKPAFRNILDELEQSPPDLELDDAAGAQDAMLAEDRRDGFQILARCPPLDAKSLAAAYGACIRGDGKFVPTIIAVSGELDVAFDEVAELEATIAIVAPLALQDEPLKILLASAKEFLAAPATARPGDVATTITARLEEAMGKSKRMSVPQLAAHRMRVLLEQRRYRVRSVFGGEHVQAKLDLAPGDDRRANKPPVYLARAAASCLPLAQRFRVRMLAEIRPGVDTRDDAPWALRALSLARVVALSPT